MLKIQEIRELIKLIDNSSINEFVYEEEGFTKVTLKKTVQYTEAVQQVVPKQQVVETVAAPVQMETAKQPTPEAPVSANNKDNLHKIESPMVGTFYASPSPDAAAYVKAGDRVSKDSVVCIIEAMKLFNEIEAEVNGEIVEILVENGQLIEYGQPLFLVKAE